MYAIVTGSYRVIGFLASCLKLSNLERIMANGKFFEAFVKSFVYFSKHSVCGVKVWKAIPERKSL